MNNLLSYCGLIDAKIRASDKDLPVHIVFYMNYMFETDVYVTLVVIMLKKC